MSDSPEEGKRMRFIKLSTAAAAAGLAAAALLAAPAHAAAPTIQQNHLVRPFVGVNSTSSNWSGYAVTSGRPYSSVTASWVQPTGSCTSQTTYSSFWIGIDGDGSNSVEQTGSEVDWGGRSTTPGTRCTRSTR
jgi:hypothetical protein